MAKPSVKNTILFEAIYQEPVSQDLSEYLKTAAGISGRSLSKYFFRGLIFLNKRKAHSSAKVKTGDAVKVLQAREQQTLAAEDVPIDIVFEHRDLLVLNKPAGMAVHPVKEITSGTLSHGVAAYFEKKGFAAKVRPVNRLDYGTSGLVIFAKSAMSQDILSKAIQEHQIVRLYYAVVQGVPASPAGVINFPIGEIRGKRFVTDNGQSAETHFRMIETYQNHSLLELKLITGRTHQIRVHLNHMVLPILGDSQYGVKSPQINRPALHAGKLNFSASTFDIPELEAPFPDDFRFLIEEMRKTNGGHYPAVN